MSDERDLVEQRLDELLASHPPADTPEQEFWGAQFDLGLPSGADTRAAEPLRVAHPREAVVELGAPELLLGRGRRRSVGEQRLQPPLDHRTLVAGHGSPSSWFARGRDDPAVAPDHLTVNAP